MSLKAIQTQGPLSSSIPISLHIFEQNSFSNTYVYISFFNSPQATSWVKKHSISNLQLGIGVSTEPIERQTAVLQYVSKRSLPVEQWS